MKDPLEGWAVLTDCLKPGGLMKIGLYSELARQDIVSLRQRIVDEGIAANSDAMIDFRSKVN